MIVIFVYVSLSSRLPFPAHTHTEKNQMLTLQNFIRFFVVREIFIVHVSLCNESLLANYI